MRIALDRVLAAVLAVAALASAAQAQTSRRPFVRYSTPASVLAARQIVVGRVRPTASPLAVSVQSSVTVPDGGTASLGGYSRMAETRSEYGAPALGRLPYTSRGFRNVGSGRSVRSGRVSIRARVISLREEEERQTGFRSP